MSIKTSASKPMPITKKRSAKVSYALAFVMASTSLLTALSVTSITTQAAGLSDLFSNNQNTSSSKFLPVDKAFQVSSSSKKTAAGTRLAINFDITPEHYVYRDQVKLTLPAGVTAGPFSFSQSPKSIDDPTYGQVSIFDQPNVVATTTLTNSSGTAINNAAIVIGWQGCAYAGLCYPPEKINTTVNIAATTKKSATVPDSNATKNSVKSADSKAVTDKAIETKANTNQRSATTPIDADKAVTVDGNNSKSSEASSTITVTGNAANSDVSTDTELTPDTVRVLPDENSSISRERALDSNDINVDSMRGADSNPIDRTTINSSVASGGGVVANTLVESDPFGLASHPWLALGLLFLAGLGLALTPCVLPMLPIVANIVARQKNPTVKKGIILTTSYAIGVSIAYGILGAVVAVFGESLGIIGWLQNPIILISFAIIFVLLALYMLGVFTVRLPRFITSKMQGLSQAGDSKLGSTGGSLVAGFLSALVVSPCVSAPLFGALLAVSTIGSPLLGFVALFMLGFGLSAPLILIGATQGKIIPKAGVWMNWVKQGFALLLFAVALLLIERVFISSVMLLVWALWFMVVATWAWSWHGKGRMLSQALGLIVGIWAACLVIGAALGNDDSLHPLASLSATPRLLQSTDGQPVSNSTTDETITTLAALDAIVAANPKVIVDVTAEWCIECRIMDKELFYNRPIQMQEWQLVKLDITETTAESKAVLARYQLFGPPALLYYKAGQLVDQQVGGIGRQTFEQTLTMLNN